MAKLETHRERTLPLKHLNENQRAFVIFQFAEDLRVREIVPRFREIYPEFGEGVDEKRLKRLLSERFRKIRRSQQERIDALREIQSADILRPELLSKFLLYEYQKLWWQAPRKILKEKGVDKNGLPYRIYKLETRSLLKIIEEVRSITKEDGEVGIIPITSRSFRLQCLQELSEGTPRVLLKRIGKNGNKVYESHAAIHLAILKQGREESEADAAVTSIAHPFYRLRCLQQLWDETFARMSREAKDSPYTHLRQRVNVLSKLLNVADLESKILLQTGCAKLMEHLPIAKPEHRELLRQVSFEMFFQRDGAESLA